VGVGGADACDAADRQITFDPAGTFTTVSGGKATAAGFWHLVWTTSTHMVMSPAFFDDPTSTSDDA
jgi:hypothetical protein